MTDQPAAPPRFDMEDYVKRARAYESRMAELHPVNKASLLTALAAAGITDVTVSFDGYGDSGQIEHVEAKAGDAIVDFPDVSVEIARAGFSSPEIERRIEPLHEAVESLCYLILEAKHGGWENNEGAYGEFVFDVAADSITFDFNYRIETTEYHSYEF